MSRAQDDSAPAFGDSLRTARGILVLLGSFAAAAALCGLILSMGLGEAAGLAAADEFGGDAGSALRQALALRDAGDRPGATEAARRALVKSPLDPGAMRLLARLAEQDGDAAAARRLMTQAARLSLRDGPSHAWLMQDALARGDDAKAVFHADILLRRNERLRRTIFPTMHGLLESPEGRRALIQRLALGPKWRGLYLEDAGRRGAPEAAAKLFDEFAASGHPPTDEELTPFFMRLVEGGQYGPVLALWHRHVPGADRATKGLYDGAFAGRPGPPPLNWQFPASRGGGATFGDADGGPGVDIHYDGWSPVSPVLRQIMFLAPGRYRLAAEVRMDDPAAANRFRIDIRCAGGPQLTRMSLESLPGRWESVSGPVVVPDGECAAQWLVFVPVAGERPQAVDIQVRRLSLRPAGGDK
jgi:hypothetical protein